MEVQQRIMALDVLRGFGILIILLTHVVMFGMAKQGDYSTFTEWGKLLFAAKQVLVEGASRFIFCIVFGVGIVVSANNRSSSRTMYLRALALIVVGLVNIFLFQWIGDFLVVFGFASIAAYYCHKFKPLALLTVALAASALFFGIYKVVMDPVQDSWNEAQYGNTVAWESLQSEYDDQLEYIDALKRQGYLGGFKATVSLMDKVVTHWIYHDIAEAFVLILVGMALYKVGFFWLKGKALVMTVVLCIAVGIALNIGLVRWQIAHEFDLYVIYSRMFPIYRVANLVMALGWISLILWLVNRGLLCGICKKISLVGKMALSNYLGQSAIMLTVFHTFGGFGKYGVPQLFAFAVVVWACQIVISEWWLKTHRFGPVESAIKAFIRDSDSVLVNWNRSL